jgi:hypothetical protein
MWQAGLGSGRLRFVFPGLPCDENSRRMFTQLRAGFASLVIEHGPTNWREGFDWLGVDEATACLNERLRAQFGMNALKTDH